MESFKKVISLNQAAKISGYSQDYLGYLIRKGEIKGIRKGKAWFTTEEQIRDYIFKKEIRNKKLAVKGFLSPTRIRNIIIVTIIIFVGGFLIFSINKTDKTPAEVVKSGVEADGEAVIIKN